MKHNKKLMKGQGERGNALFLILIAVALFAALSYAITQSGRGGGNVTSQTVLITAGQVVEQPAAVRAAVTRMMVTGTSASSITFTGTASATDVFDTVTGGGGATNLAPPVAACITAADCNGGWTYVQATSSATGIFVHGVGTTTLGDAFAILQAGTAATNGVTSAVCTQIQKGLGFSNVAPPVQTTGVVWGTAGAYSAAAGGSATTVAGSASNELSGQDFGCFKNGTPFAYYAVLIDQ